MDTATHIANGGGICGTCAHPATATSENEGYSSCCNDRIEYGIEAADTLKRATCKHEHGTVERRDSYNHCTDLVCPDCGEYADSL